MDHVFRDKSTSAIMLNVTTNHNVYLHPDEIAEAIWHMDSEQQVIMLNHLASLIDYGKLAMQLHYVSDGDLTLDARMLMQQVGEYAMKHGED